MSHRVIAVLTAGFVLLAGGAAGGSAAAADPTAIITPGYKLAQVAATGEPVDVAPGSDGTVWVAALGGATEGSITHLKPTGMGAQRLTHAPNALASDDEGGVWATMPEANEVVHMDRDNSYRSWTVPTPGGRPVAAYDSGGYVYFVEHDAKKLGRIDQVTGDIVDFAISGAVSPSRVDGIADPDGSHHTVWVTDPGAGRVWVLDTAGSLVGSIDSLGSAIDIQLLASSGGLVEGIASTETSLLYFKQAPGSMPVTALVVGRTHLTGMEADDGGVWLADSGSSTLVFFKDGSLTEYSTGGLSGLSGIAVAEDRSIWSARRADGVVTRLEPDAEREVDRIGGADRYEVSARVSATMHPAGASTVFVASGQVFADALSVGPLAAQVGAPLLLTSRETLPGSVAAELARLKPAHVVVVGGTDSVASAIESRIRDITTADVARIGGADRYAVSRALLTGPFAPRSNDELFIANGSDYPDALSSGPAASTAGSGVLLVDGKSPALSAAELELVQTLVQRHGVITISGGPNSVSAGILAQLRTIRSTTRIDGADRYEVSQRLNDRYFSGAAHAFLASGSAFPDALTGGVAAAAAHSPLYLAHPDCIPGGGSGGALAPSVGKLTLLGGPATLSPAVESLTVCP